MTPAACIPPAFKRSRPEAGERVVAFEDARGKQPWELAEIAQATPPTRASGSYKGLLIQDREDRRAAAERGGYPEHPRTKPTFWQARDWAFKAGFRGVELYAAAAAAALLREEHGAGKVTTAMVRERITAP